MSSELDAIGRLFQDHLELRARCTIDSKSGQTLKCSKTSGRRVSWNTTKRKELTGSGRLSMAQLRRLPLGGKSTGPNPTDRAKSGVKRSLHVEAEGVPIGVAVSGANTHDMKLVEPTLENMMVERPKPTKMRPQNMCLDKGFDFPEIDELVAEWGYTGRIARKGVDQSKRERIPGYRARRWVVEWTTSWMNRFRRLLIRWEKKEENYLAMLHFACAWITYQQTGIFG